MAKRKLICVAIPCYNEQENVVDIARAVEQQFQKFLPRYNYHIQFIDNCSTDNTRALLEHLCAENKHIRAIFNARNFGGISGYYGLVQTSGDCSIIIPCDFQVPVELIPVFVAEWEKGAKIVCAIKTSSKENKFMWWLRSLYYSLAQRFSEGKMLKHFTGSGLYDKSFLDLCRRINDPVGGLMQIISTLGYNIVEVPFVQPRRKRGKSKNNIWNLFDVGVSRFINHSSIGPRIATILGFLVAVISAAIGVVFLILKLLYWNRFPAGIAPIVIIISFTAAVQIFFTGLMGEYIININKRLMRRPLVIEERRINFEPGEERSDKQ